MWKGRFKEQTSALLQRFSESVSFDCRLYRHDIAGSIAHAAALARAGYVTESERAAIEAGLREIQLEIERGEFSWDPKLEDVHMNIESALTARIGDAGAKLHTARSRNDQVALDLRLYLRDAIADLQQKLRVLQQSLVTLGAENSDVIIPGYTHLQRAQPVYLAHHLLAYVEMFARDSSRLADAARRMDVLPLGAGALAGSTLLIDRAFVAEQLGFGAVAPNSMDAVSDRDFACETLAAIAIAGMHLSRLSEDLILWASAEFAFIRISDAFTTGSSLMPQKKNPDVCELTRGRTGRLYGNLLALLTVLKGLPMTYNRDLQEDKESLFDSVDHLGAMLEVMAAMLVATTIDRDRTARAVADPNLLATDLADYLVEKGVPFRQAHEYVGRAVARCAELACELPALPLAEYRRITPHFDDQVLTVLNLQRSMQARRAIGAPSPANVAAQLDRWQQLLA